MRELIDKLRKKSVGADASVRPFLREISKEGKGITLIALIITIVVMLILVSVTVTFTIGENGILSSAKEAKFKTEVSQLMEEYYINLEVAKMDKDFKKEDLYANKELGNLKEWIPSIKENYENKLHIEAGKLCANSSEITEQEAKWLNDLGIQANAITATATTDLWQLDQTNTRIIKYIGKDGDGLVKDGETIIIPNRVYNSSTNTWYKITHIGDGQNLVFANTQPNVVKNVRMTFAGDLIIEKTSFSYNQTFPILQLDELIIENGVIISNISYVCVNKKIVIGDNCNVEHLKINGNVEEITIGDNCILGSLSEPASKNCKSITIGNNATIDGQFCAGNNDNLQTIKIGTGLTIEEGYGKERFLVTGFNRITDLNVYIKGLKYAGTKLAPMELSKVNLVIEKIEDNAIIEEDAFYKEAYTSMKIDTIGENVTIGNYAFFESNIGTSNLNIGKKSQIGDYAFVRCKGIEKLIIGDSTTINYAAFMECDTIEEITIGNDITNLGRNVFANNPTLKNVIIGNNNKLSENVFYNCTGIESLTIGDGTEIIYKTTLDGCSGIKQVTLGDAIIPAGTFEDCNNIEKVKIKDGAGANFAINLFKDITTIKTVELGENITLVSNLFDNTGIESLTIKKGTEIVGGSSFANCSQLQTLKIEAEETEGGATIFKGSATFRNCEKLNSVELQEGVKVVLPANTIFYGCKALEKITIPNSFGYVPQGIFVACTNLKEIEIEGGENTVEVRATALNANNIVDSIKLPKNVKLDKNSLGNATIGKIEIDRTMAEVQADVLMPWGAKKPNLKIECSDGTIEYDESGNLKSNT